MTTSSALTVVVAHTGSYTLVQGGKLASDFVPITPTMVGVLKLIFTAEGNDASWPLSSHVEGSAS